MQYYIAFSIHGTNCFISASIERTEDGSEKPHSPGIILFFGNRKFKVISSRRDNFNVKKEVKLQSDELLTKNGNSIKSPPMILKFFNQLEKEGWKLHNKQEFINKHWRK